MSRLRILSLAMSLGLAFGLGGAFLSARQERAAVSSPQQPTLAQETRRLETEYPLAASRKPYLILDLLAGRFDYRIAGVTLKTIPFRIDSIQAPAPKEKIGADRQTLLTLHDRGAAPEVIRPPDPDAPADPLKDPKIFPPDPPTDYTLSFDRPLKIRIRGEEAKGVRSGLVSAGKTVRDWFGAVVGEGRQGVRVRIRLPAEQAQEIYRGLFEGEKILVLGLGETEGKAVPKVSGG